VPADNGDELDEEDADEAEEVALFNR